VKHGIKGFDQMSLGMVATTIYLSGCNFRCPFCHNSGLVISPDKYETVPVAEILSYVREHADFLDGIVVSGGEPCFRSETPELLRELKGTGLGVKLDTNGSFPDMLERLIGDGLLDYVAMDIKAPLDLESYSRSAGIHDQRTLERVRSSVDILMEGRVDYEFRMTVVPALHRSTDLQRIGDQLRGAARFVLQKYIPRTTLDPAFEDEPPYDLERLEEFREMLSPAFEECLIRSD
jgi:pyruvate formate lyase activating enzyme